MEKIIKAELIREGKIILCAKMLRTKWCVFQYNTKGRWQKAIGNYDCFVYKESCDGFIDALARHNANIIRYEFDTKNANNHTQNANKVALNAN